MKAAKSVAMKTMEDAANELHQDNCNSITKCGVSCDELGSDVGILLMKTYMWKRRNVSVMPRSELGRHCGNSRKKQKELVVKGS